ncbi:hypothetical protein ASPZODRAFT_1713093 [Penicilliopsis zonata CBS 506.65]|uniref:F-box domain-containing protein n=1 Tax=Penicilliopsis zonata CBS 506.65 TaxID=1073090 RepID=A0A1L9SK49_9EURO|nr:hypothetical protein ASPZODRAFT_1713093 [Penicilliopsis zonata CBS 506.65]OJJ47545.1 hypothetical protein ASPZODRAFT_1713093 [Penicilliopsis zonata CBS 506.65]
MSIVASRPECPTVPYSPVAHQSHVVSNYKDSDYAVTVQPISTRSPSVSSFKSNYSVSTSPTIFSPTSPSASFSAFGSSSSLPKLTDSIFKRLPQEVYDGILDRLQYLHTGPHQAGCTTCFQRDLHALSLTCRAWEKAARGKLYNRIHIMGNDSPAQLKKYRMKRGSRLKLLRRTLRERKLLANLVLELRVPQMDMVLATGKQSTVWQEYRDLVASVVMVCPNLERLLGLTIPFNHEFDRLTHALSTRKKLKEHTWILGEAPEALEGSPRSSSCPGSLGPLEMFEFLNYHASWTNLESLMLYALDEHSAMEPSIFLRMFSILPSLRHLCISSFDADAFGDSTLLCLPALESLRLESLPGVTDAGLTQYTSRPEAQSLKSLTIIEQDIESLLVVSKILASLRQLERFKIVQAGKCPTLPLGSMILQPLLASSTLKYLHWDVVSPNAATALSTLETAPFQKPPRHIETPNSHLAQSILAAGFPQLEAVRAPSDIEPAGVIQSVCRPITRGRALLQPDRYSLPRSSHGSVSTRPMALPAGNNLTSARIRAQTFIDMAAKDTETGMKVIVTDHSDGYVPENAEDVSSDDESADMDMEEFGVWKPRDKHKVDLASEEERDGPVTVYEFRMPAYMGRVGTRSLTKNAPIPKFILRPDIPGADADGGLVGWKHLLTSNQSLTYASGVGTTCFGNRASTMLLPLEEPLSPASTPTTSRFGWGSIGSRSALATSPNTPITPTTPWSLPSSSTPPWEKDICTGSWNHGHKNGRDWSYHIERERPGNAEPIDIRQFF